MRRSPSVRGNCCEQPHCRCAVARPIVQRNADTCLVQRGRRRPFSGVGATTPFRGHGAQRHGRNQPAACGPGRPRHPEKRRQRRRRGRGRFRRAQPRRADERRSGRRPVCHRLHREGKQALHVECEREGPERSDACPHELSRVLLEFWKLGPRFRHAAGGHSDGHGARHRLGLGRGAAPLRHDDVQGNAAAGHRLRGERFPRVGANRKRLASPSRARASSGRRPRVLHPGGP